MLKEDGRFAKQVQEGMSYRKYSNLCVELKFLYVAITRAKNRVLIYDSYETKRKPVLDYWNKMGVVHVVTKQMLQEPDKYMSPEIAKFYERGIADQSSTPEQWKLQGIKMFRKKYYDQAMKCFQYSGDSKLVLRCAAH